jgi:hypothetical protein
MLTKPRTSFFAGLVLASLAGGAIIAACGGSDSSNGDEPPDLDAGDDTSGAGDGTGVDGTGFDVSDGGDGSGGDGSGGDGTSVDTGDTTPSGFDGAPPVDADFPCDGCTSFPPVGAPACPSTTLAAPKVVYPPDGVLLPPNMNVLEVQFKEATGATLYEVSFTNSVTSVRVTTACVPVPNVRGGASLGCGLTLPLGAWKDIADENRDGDPVHVTVRATKDGSCVSTSTDKIDIKFARDDLAGGIYYWQSATFGGVSGTTGGIYSHDFGTLDPTPTPFYTSGATGTCVGCHNLSRDGQRMALATDDPDADDEFGDVKTHVMDVAKRAVIGGATMSPGFQTFTHDHLKMIASTYKTSKNAGFAVFDGDGTKLLVSPTPPLSGGLLGTQPDLARDDKTLVYVVPGKLGTATSISAQGDHHFLGGSIYTSSFDATSNAIGTPALVLAPSTTTQNFFYPSFSPNGTFLVLNDAPKEDAFYNRNARVKLLHYPSASGAKPLDLPALNVADGLTNSWPRWSPFVQTYKGKKLLWLTFSSNRDYGLHLVNQGLTYVDPTSGATLKIDNCYPPEGPTNAAYGNDPQPLSKTGVTMKNCQQPQIWMAAVIVDEDGSLDTTDRSFPAFWLPFQDVNSHNHSAQWVEKVVAPPVGPPGDAGPDGGGSDGGDGGTSDGGSSDAGPTCVPAGGGCSAALCCTDVVCCGTTCAATCIK